ncbi:MAG: helix-turn-helix domain-containing protein [Lachnospiraceae bacterium]|nr:helix-turn-helix domain-containing protein [Lachnospiraceae bacterium]
MEFLSTTEVAKKWGVSRKTVTRYAADGKIEGAYLVGNTWMIPANARKVTGTVLNVQESKTDISDVSEENEYHFPLYLYRDFYNLKQGLKRPEELKLYSAFEEALKSNYKKTYELSKEAFSITDDLSIRITCLYLMARSSLYENNYNLFMKHTLELNRIFAKDFDHKKELKTLLIDLETYYKGFDSLMEASFDATVDYSDEVYPIITTMTLYRQILQSFKTRQEIDTTMYEMSLKFFETRGYIYPSILLSSELAFIYNQKMDTGLSNRYAKYAYDLANKNNGFLMLVDLYSLNPRLLDKALKHYKTKINPTLVRMTKEHKKACIGLMIHLKKPQSLFSFIRDDYDYIYYAIYNYSNKEIAAEKKISESAVAQRYTRLCRSFNVSRKKELVEAFIEKLGEY